MTTSGAAPARRRRPGTAGRLAAFLAILLTAILAVTAYETARAFASLSITSTTRSLVAEVDSFGRATDSVPSSGLDAATVAYLHARVLEQGESVMVALPSGARLGSAGSAGLLATPEVRRLLAAPPTGTTSVRTTLDGVDTLLLATPIRQDGTVVGSLVVASDLSQLHADQNRVLVLVAGEALVALVAAVAGAYLLLRRLLRTVGDITDTAASIESGDLDRRLGDQGTDDEVAKLAATFDSMLDRLQAAMVVQRRLLSDVSHQLRTPLTVARGHLEVLARQPDVDVTEVRETVAVVVDELDHMRALVERLLLLGRALEPDFLQTERLDLRSFISDLSDSAQVLAPRRWGLSPVPDVVVEADVAKLRGALLNLVDNAVKATTPSDTIELRVVRSPEDGSLTLSVEDSGPGIPDDQLATVLSRFGRIGNADREGSGLGLAIVTTVAEAHGGHFSLGWSDLGGCRAAITLPASAVTAGVVRDPVGV